MQPHPTDTTPDRQALHWLIALQERPGDPGLRQRFDHWRRQSPAHDAAWRDLGGLDTLIVTAERAAAPRPDSRPVPTGRHRRFLPRPILAAAAAMAACLALVLLPSLQVRWHADAITGTGEIRRLTLADGSHVTLAPDSAIAITMAGDHRAVALLRGEAFFEVSRDPDRPFTATAGDSSARVLGTAFNLRRLTDGAEISVAEGSVQVSRGDRSHRLTAGEWADTGGADLTVHGTVPTELVAPWRQGQLAVKDRRLGDVIDILRRYHAGAIVIHGAALAERRVTGIYDLRAPRDALDALVAPLSGRVVRLTPWLLLVVG